MVVSRFLLGNVGASDEIQKLGRFCPLKHLARAPIFDTFYLNVYNIPFYTDHNCARVCKI